MLDSASHSNELDRAKDLQVRTKQFALRVIRMFQSLPRAEEERILGRQVLRSGTSMAANYRASCQGRSEAEFVAKLGIVVEEADETIFWLEMLVESEIVSEAKMKTLLNEARELQSIFGASLRTARRSLKR